MKAQIIKKSVLKNIPSASGIEIVNGIIYIIGDDSPFLYVLDHNLNVLNQIQLFESENFESGRIPKSLKFDLESITSLIINQHNYLLIIGSGANTTREKGYLVKLPTKFNKNHLVTELSLSKLYDLLRLNRDIVEDSGLNIEGLATTDNNLIMLNRANGNADNTALIFDIEEFIVFLMENSDMTPFPHVVRFDLPGKVKAGFSGAAYFDNLIFFTASTEYVADAINDGEIGESMIGIIEMRKSTMPLKKNNPTILSTFQSAIVEENGSGFIGKIESIAVYEKEDPSKYIALAVTDNDLGESLLLMIEISLV